MLYLIDPSRLKNDTLFEHKTLIYPKYNRIFSWHYGDVIMGVLASQITSLTIVYSNVYSGADQRKHQSSASLAFFVRGIPRRPVNSPHKWPVTGKCFHLMTSSWKTDFKIHSPMSWIKPCIYHFYNAATKSPCGSASARRNSSLEICHVDSL